MKTQQEINKYEIDIDYIDYESVIKGFLLCSAQNRINEFDFDEAFDLLIEPIIFKLEEHGLCSFEDFSKNRDIWIDCSGIDWGLLTVQTDYIHISEEEVKEAVYSLYHKKFKYEFSGMFDHLVEMKEKYENMHELSLKDKIILFDEIIHAQHTCGDIFDMVDIEDLKTDLDEEIIEIMGIEQQYVI
jgi:hypothetical protein